MSFSPCFVSLQFQDTFRASQISPGKKKCRHFSRLNSMESTGRNMFEKAKGNSEPTEIS
jgi:hypothetical protein